MTKPYEPKSETMKLVEDFDVADKKLKDELDKFEIAHQQELDVIEDLMLKRNCLLDEARRALRNEAVELDYGEHKWFKAGPFSVQKKWTSFFLADRFHAIVQDHKLEKDALEAKAIILEVTVPYKEAEEWIRKNKLEDLFDECKDGKELTPAVSGPKPLVSFGSEIKDQRKE